MALMIVPILGALALGGEVGSWYFTQRSAQNAADSAALAAATSGCAATGAGCQATFGHAAAAVAAKYNFTNGVDNTVLATTAVTCPGGGLTPCYQVQITKTLPVGLSRVVGFNGNTTLGAGRGQTVQATAIAKGKVITGFCIMGFATSGNAFRINGGPSFDLGGCDVYSNANMTCNGSGDFGIAASVAVGTSNCGAAKYELQPALTDPFVGLSTNANIPAAPGGCAARTFTSTQTVALSTITDTCGNFTINNNVTLTVTGTGVLRIYQTAANNGNLVLSNGNSKLLASEGLTIIFSGTAGNNSPGFISGSGVVDYAAPTSGTWSGIAVYQDNRMTKSKSWSYSGNSPTFNLTGLTYARYADITFSGAINHHTGGRSCMGVLANTLLVSGTGSIFDNPTSECEQAGLTLPTGKTELARQLLVQ